ncbi:ComF family protein [Marinobacter fonticola]|uniref:ComF family protein n=1 Tax=Marinobacter fonticola TaxID=2603215 RepID=UPI0011E674B3|nr:ComF family protein [Marinobacter fonticola]
MINCLRALSTFIQPKVNISHITPHLCAGCLSPTRTTGLCPGCRGDLPRNDAACAHCALPLASLAAHHAQSLCGPCISQPPAFDKVLAPWLYGFPVNGLVSHFKYGKQRAFGRPLAELLAQEIANSGVNLPDCLIPVPMPSHRLRQRGFNQAEEIALWLADSLDIPVTSRVVHRKKQGETQSGLTRRQRLVNLKGAFEVIGDVPEHVALVDDVVTTAATAQELARTLKKAGARTVDVWALARTPKVPTEDL